MNPIPFHHITLFFFPNGIPHLSSSIWHKILFILFLSTLISKHQGAILFHSIFKYIKSPPYSTPLHFMPLIIGYLKTTFPFSVFLFYFPSLSPLWFFHPFQLLFLHSSFFCYPSLHVLLFGGFYYCNIKGLFIIENDKLVSLFSIWVLWLVHSINNLLAA